MDWVLASLLLSSCSAFQFTIYSGMADTDASKTFTFGAAQRCYDLASCWSSHKTRAGRWKKLPSDGQLAFYSAVECQGTKVTTDSESGAMDFDVTDLKGNISSFMVLQSGQYATAGFTRICDEAAVVSNGTAA